MPDPTPTLINTSAAPTGVNSTGTPVVATSASLFYYTPASQFARLAGMAVPAQGESQQQATVRQNAFTMSVLCSLYSISGTPAAEASTPPTIIGRSPMIMDSAPTAATLHPPTPATGIPYIFPASSFGELVQFVGLERSLVGLCSLFLTSWNAAAQSGDTQGASSALQLWKANIASALKSDVADALFYDASTSTLLVLPTASLQSLENNSGIASLWANGEPFGQPLVALAQTSYSGPFSSAPAAAANKVTDWLNLGIKIVVTIGTCGTVIATAPTTEGASLYFGGALCVASVADSAQAAAQLNSDYSGTPEQTQTVDIPATEVPSDIPVETPDGSIVASPGDSDVSGPDSNTTDEGPEPDPKQTAAQ